MYFGKTYSVYEYAWNNRVMPAINPQYLEEL